MESTQTSQRPSPNWLKAIVITGVVWGQFVLLGATVMEPTPENLTLLWLAPFTVYLIFLLLRLVSGRQIICNRGFNRFLPTLLFSIV